MIPGLALVPYRLPLRRPWRSAQGVRRQREGWLVQASHGGCCGYGDCAPLPEAGTETPPAALERLSTWLSDHHQSSLQTQLAALEDALASATPAADAALETALLDLSARLCGLRLSDYLIREQSPAAAIVAESHPAPALAPEPDLQPDLGSEHEHEHAHAHETRLRPEPRSKSSSRSAIAVNAALGAIADLRPEPLERALAAGFRVLKLKVGVAAIDRELEAIRHLSARLPADVRLRLDANRAWTLATTAKLIEALRPIANRIECLEEPCAEATDIQLRALQAQAPFALALDESLPARGWPLDPWQLPLRRLVLKPGVMGGLRPTLTLARRAQAVGREIVITSLIESAAGLWSSAQLAAATGSPLAHGLATADWLAADLGPAPAIKAGRIQLPRRPGSGFSPWSPSGNVGA
jgi:o-succinylbenzoate synthase